MENRVFRALLFAEAKASSNWSQLNKEGNGKGKPGSTEEAQGPSGLSMLSILLFMMRKI